MISRRDFVGKSALASVATLTSGTITTKGFGFQFKHSDNGPSIVKFTIFPASGNFYRFIGPNAYDEKPKGIKGNPRKTILVELSDGPSGWAL